MEMRVKDYDGAGSKITYDKLPITNGGFLSVFVPERKRKEPALIPRGQSLIGNATDGV